MKIWKQLSLSVSYFVFIGAAVWHLFILIPHLYIDEVPTKNPQETFWTHEIPTRKNLTKAPLHDGTPPTMAQDPLNLVHLRNTDETIPHDYMSRLHSRRGSIGGISKFKSR